MENHRLRVPENRLSNENPETPVASRERFLRDYEQTYSEFRNQPDEWAEIQAERRALDGALMDGLGQADN